MTERKIAAIGDLVECIYKGNYYGQFHEGGLYRVTVVYQEYETLRYLFALDDLGSKTNGWVAKHFRLATEQPMNQGEYEAILADQDAYEALKED